jgi:1,4-dihydroxy-2-naphthoate octaprenyltransferase
MWAYLSDARVYFTLLRLPYQLQLGPIFGWGYLLAGGRWIQWDEAARFVAVFLLFHIGAFGGLTALNSFYDRDTGPIGGLWKPPPPPSRLWAFAWAVQLGGLVLLLSFGWNLAAVYSAILLLSLGYSHPRTRWKGHPWRSLAVVATGQGILDFAAGALTASVGSWPVTAWWGMAGVTLTVAAFYPLTQLFQVRDDEQRGDRTLASCLVRRFSRRGLFIIAGGGILSGTFCNALALAVAGHTAEGGLFLLAGFLPPAFLTKWSQDAQPSPQTDFSHVHRLLRIMALAFAVYIGIKLLRGGLYQ